VAQYNLQMCVTDPIIQQVLELSRSFVLVGLKRINLLCAGDSAGVEYLRLRQIFLDEGGEICLNATPAA
jgi:hypothetical protein